MSDASNPEIIDYAMEPEAPKAPWKPLNSKQRRVLGTLIEKSKTTPDAYPMTVSSLTTGCNQKSNRAPIMNLSIEQVEDTVGSLRDLGAVAIVQGIGRVEKIRHYAYQWLGINKAESAIMTELLLRGEQTLGELRTRASRMEPIQDLNELASLLKELENRRLVVFLSPPGRGQMVSHNLYLDSELEVVKKSVAERTSGPTQEHLGDSPEEDRLARSALPTHDLQKEISELRERIQSLEARLSSVEDLLK